MALSFFRSGAFRPRTPGQGASVTPLASPRFGGRSVLAGGGLRTPPAKTVRPRRHRRVGRPTPGLRRVGSVVDMSFMFAPSTGPWWWSGFNVDRAMWSYSFRRLPGWNSGLGGDASVPRSGVCNVGVRARNRNERVQGETRLFLVGGMGVKDPHTRASEPDSSLRVKHLPPALRCFLQNVTSVMLFQRLSVLPKQVTLRWPTASRFLKV